MDQILTSFNDFYAPNYDIMVIRPLRVSTIIKITPTITLKISGNIISLYVPFFLANREGSIAILRFPYPNVVTRFSRMCAV